MKSTFWFTAGAAAATYVIFKGKRIYEEYVPEAVRRQIADRTDVAAVDLGRFSANFRAAMDEREAEIRSALHLPEE